MTLDHFNIRTRRLAETVRFYEDILGLTCGPRPAQPVDGRWMYSGTRAVLHLLESAPTARATGPLDHVAFQCSGLEGLLERLRAAGIARIARAIPGMPLVQVQFLDPNGILVEANFTNEALQGPGDSLAIDAHEHFEALRKPSAPSASVRSACTHGVTTAYEVVGSGPLLLLIHGAEADRRSFSSILPLLSPCFTCVIYDQRDSGDTRAPTDDYTAADLADDAAALIGTLGPRAHVWGNSFGGMIAQELALRHPERVDALVLGVTFQRGATALLDPEGIKALRERQPSDPGARRELLSRFFTPQTAQHRPHLIDAALEAFTQRPADVQARRSRVTQRFDSEGRLAAIRARTLVLGAFDDRVIAPSASLGLAQEIPAATLIMLNGVGHALTFEAPARVARLVTQFLQASGHD